MVRVRVCGCPTCLRVCQRLPSTQSPCRPIASRATRMQVFYAADLGEQLSAFSGMTLLKQALWLRHALQIVSARHGHQPVILLGWTARARSRHMSTHSQTQSHSKLIQLSADSPAPCPRRACDCPPRSLHGRPACLRRGCTAPAPCLPSSRPRQHSRSGRSELAPLVPARSLTCTRPAPRRALVLTRHVMSAGAFDAATADLLQAAPHPTLNP